MERLWSLAGATSGNRWQMRTAREREKQAKTVAVGCDQLRHGKEGVDGSSPSEGSERNPAKMGFLLSKPRTLRRAWVRDGYKVFPIALRVAGFFAPCPVSAMFLRNAVAGRPLGRQQLPYGRARSSSHGRHPAVASARCSAGNDGRLDLLVQPHLGRLGAHVEDDLSPREGEVLGQRPGLSPPLDLGVDPELERLLDNRILDLIVDFPIVATRLLPCPSTPRPIGMGDDQHGSLKRCARTPRGVHSRYASEGVNEAIANGCQAEDWPHRSADARRGRGSASWSGSARLSFCLER